MPRCLLEPRVPGVRSFSGLSAVVAHPQCSGPSDPRRAPSRPAPPGELGSLWERGPAPAPIYALAVRNVWAGQEPIGPGAGSGGRGGGRGCGPPLLSCEWAGRCAAGTSPAWSLVPRGAQGHFANPPPYQCAAAVPPAGEWQPQPAVIRKAAALAAV